MTLSMYSVFLFCHRRTSVKLISNRQISPTWISVSTASTPAVAEFWLQFLLLYNFRNVYVVYDPGHLYRLNAEAFVTEFKAQQNRSLVLRLINSNDNVNYTSILDDYHRTSRGAVHCGVISS